MKQYLKRLHPGLILILLFEIWLLSGSFGAFFNHDSLFYLIHAPRSWEQLIGVMTGPDPTQQFRPMTLVVMGLFLPLFRLDPLPYHLIPMAFHVFNTVLFWSLARRLLPSSTAALVATGFWGLHAVAAFVTYDIGYFPDFLMAFFALSSLILAVDATRNRSRVKAALSLLLYVLALLSKEAMVALPIVLLICLVLAEVRDKASAVDRKLFPGALKKVLPLTVLFLAVALLYAGMLYLWLQSGRLYAQGAAQAYDISPLANLAGKTHYLFWAMNLPDALSIPHPNLNRALALLLMAVLPGVWVFGLLRRKGRFSLVELGGMAWMLGMLVPACMLSSRTAKWYLYVPVMGLALLFGAAAADMQRFAHTLLRKTSGPAVVAIFLVPILFSSRVQNQSFLRSSDSSYGSTVVYNCLHDFQAIAPSLPPAVTLFLLPTFETNVAAFFGGGALYSLYYPESRIQMLFADHGATLPEDFAKRNDIRILRYLYGHIYDETEYYKERRLDSCSRKIVTELSAVHATVNRAEFYPDYENFGTPGGGPVFFPAPGNDIFSQIGGSEAAVELGVMPPKARLRFDVSWMHDQGDGGWAILTVRANGKEDTLYKEYMQPNPSGSAFTWREVNLDLESYENEELVLVLKCTNSPGNNTVADWLNWRDIRLESPAFDGPQCHDSR